jgi:hypothetical protein
VRVERRDFLFLRAGQPATLSCERLFMRFLDSQLDGTTSQLFDNLAADLCRVASVRLTDTAWLSRADLKQQLDPVLASFASRGGRIV